MQDIGYFHFRVTLKMCVSCLVKRYPDSEDEGYADTEMSEDLVESLLFSYIRDYKKNYKTIVFCIFSTINVDPESFW